MVKPWSFTLPAALALVALSGCAVGPSPAVDAAVGTPATTAGLYVVQTIWKDAPISNSRVEWRTNLEDDVPALAGTTNRFGKAYFRQTDGMYFLTGEWRPDGDFSRPRNTGDRVAYLGGNPFYVSSNGRGEISLILTDVPPLPTVPPPEGTGVFGRVTLDGAPAGDVAVWAFSRSDTGFKGSDFTGFGRTDEDGYFSLDLPPGRYFILAKQREESVNSGPMRRGDLLGYDPANPLVVDEGRRTLSAVPAKHLKRIRPTLDSPDFLAGAMIEGRILDREGRPKEGVHATLYGNPNLAGRPLFLSEMTGDDGKFRVSVPVAGTYFLVARSGYGGPPATGDWFGTFDGTADHSIVIQAGEQRSGVDIVVDRLQANVKPQPGQ